jgi:hypothetical protein
VSLLCCCTCHITAPAHSLCTSNPTTCVGMKVFGARGGPFIHEPTHTNRLRLLSQMPQGGVPWPAAGVCRRGSNTGWPPGVCCW